MLEAVHNFMQLKKVGKVRSKAPDLLLEDTLKQFGFRSAANFRLNRDAGVVSSETDLEIQRNLFLKINWRVTEQRDKLPPNLQDETRAVAEVLTAFSYSPVIDTSQGGIVYEPMGKMREAIEDTRLTKIRETANAMKEAEILAEHQWTRKGREVTVIYVTDKANEMLGVT